jgi:hypothetical protein
VSLVTGEPAVKVSPGIVTRREVIEVRLIEGLALGEPPDECSKKKWGESLQQENWLKR